VQQPIGAGVEKEPELVGLPAMAGGAVGPGINSAASCRSKREAWLELTTLSGGSP
jgi:hypothetical protein